MTGTLGRAYCELNEDESRYIFPILVRNPSEIENAIARAELWIGYRRHGVRYVVKVPHDDRIGVEIQKAGEAALILPAAIDIRGAISGAIGFTIPAGLIEDSEIQDFTLRLEDSRGQTIDIPKIFIEGKYPPLKSEEQK
ncbi:hypothetical protein IMZ11_16605 [Microtetraspora sp. AC03309]|uniref:hypothetical protein n=1 Tax=Microtetraspora sp. AC03309 TaxID=2779376 RepID=UPI001E405827|nr:hypothetical protein [Microtetraspora sp. AC03309]MCC5577248.1 hypothetical protein [Microtetraspora sp. AC03309]